MPAAGATQGQSETALSFALIKRQRELQQPINAVEKSACLLLTENVVLNFFFQTAFRPQLVHEVWVRQEAHVENNVGIVRNAELVTERRKKQRHTARRRRVAKLLLHLMLELMHVKVTGVDHLVGQGTDRFQRFAFARNAVLNRTGSR